MAASFAELRTEISSHQMRWQSIIQLRSSAEAGLARAAKKLCQLKEKSGGGDQNGTCGDE
ncbi:hypothetical protein GCM10011385_02560 [Nitratireductor aestuarii]|uniref:Uncharacterized protein n=1 Tax=Nitratireductor aestuarii TaxID=1735103 RepID=A0A916VYP2_9HYPH|nr:hypothetical protein GCM10011385_02560 [Nitratireductor aestuarii]